ncbi:MAG: Ig-like domain-containing protein [Polyangiales bacterium]
MSLRALILCSLLAVVGCSGSEDVAGELTPDAAGTGMESLEFEVPAESPLPNDQVALTVRYRDAEGRPQPGVLVDFSLVGAAAGGSLSPTKSLTAMVGQDAVASTTLRTGSTASELQVRARAGTNAFAYITLSVRSALGTRVSVGVKYGGARKIASYTVTSLVEMSCAQALASGIAGGATFQFSAPDSLATFELGYGLSAALVGWGKDETGSKLVRGCQEIEAPTTADLDKARSLVTLELVDLDLTLQPPLALQMEINASAAVRRFAESAGRAVSAVVSPNAAYSMFADADYLLDAVQNTLTAQGNTLAATTLAARRTTDSLAATLQPALSAKQAGPTAYGTSTGQELARRGASLMLFWTLGDENLRGLSAQSADGSQTLPFTNLPPTSIVTRFVPASAELSIDQMRVNLGLGSYGRTLFASLDTAARLESSGCASVFASWWTRSLLTDLVPEADAQAACVAAFGQLDSAIDSELAQLDVGGSALQLAGSVQAHARNDDGKVDDLGPGELAGSWGMDTLQASLRSPQRTAFQ